MTKESFIRFTRASIVAIVFATAFALIASAAEARYIHYGGGGGGSRSGYTQQLCKPFGVDDYGERIWRCRDKEGRKKRGGVKPVMRCQIIERTHTKFIYCSDRTRIDLQ